jgi:membrane protein required for colicin V production
MRNTDILLIVPLIWGTYRGFYKGIISQIVSLVAIVLVFYVSLKFYIPFGTFANSLVHTKLSPGYFSIASFVVLFIILYVLIYILSQRLEKMTESLHISLINHIAGGVFGLIKWAFMISVIISLLNIFGDKADFTFIKFNHSWLYNHIQTIAPEIMPGLVNKSA